jgi:hypothetical protein
MLSKSDTLVICYDTWQDKRSDDRVFTLSKLSGSQISLTLILLDLRLF